MKPTVSILIISDVVCPWCYVGKKRLEQTLDSLKNDYDFAIQWLPFELNPALDEQGEDFKAYITDKFGSVQRVQQGFDQLTQIGKPLGIDFQFEKIQKAFKTLFLHKILHQAYADGNQNQIAERLFQAYFTEGIDLTDKNELLQVLNEWGWTDEKLNQTLDNQQINQEIKAIFKQIYSLGVSGVPFYIFNQKVALSGAQPPEVFSQAIAQSLAN
ncbi:MAG: DsbA family oxidoreductase [Microscillaceae bacterium]|jgi:predicted DsbA family dithiol-disulfide isomerase|nr:DsbA family oxidoreductase [Microscillaceae bacterium]